MGDISLFSPLIEADSMCRMIIFLLATNALTGNYDILFLIQWDTSFCDAGKEYLDSLCCSTLR